MRRESCADFGDRTTTNTFTHSPHPDVTLAPLVQVATLGGTELSLLPLMVVFYVGIPLGLLYLVARGGDEDDHGSSTDEDE